MKVVIDKFNVNTGFTEKCRSLMYSSLLWHKVMVENVQNLDRDFVLKTLMNAVHPLDFIPVSYEVCPEHASFLLKNCGAALEYLCRHNLVVQNPNNKDKPFMVSIELCIASANDLKINVQSNVVCVIQKRLSTDGVLHLEQFYKDPSLNEFCPLSQPKLMFFILHLSKSYNVKVLKLANNQIEILKPLEALYGVKSIVSLDLRNNNISNVSELKALKDLSITELWLDGNPVCKEYDEFTYGRAMQEIIGGLAKLDGFTITKKGGFMPFRRNFLCNIEGQELVDQFLEHYFTIYDSPNRNALNGVYHKQALFSLTSRYLVMQSTSPVAKLNAYTQFSRNIKQISDFSKNDLYLFKGPQSILKIFNSLPRTEHDPHTFAIDLMSYTDTTAVIVVTGVFQELYESELNLGKQYGFVRTFVLLAGQNSEYTIVNEQLHVSNATTIQALKAFKIQRPKKMNYIHIPPPQNIKERYELIETMKIITGLNMEWSKNCLEDAQYNLKNALTTFVELYKLDKIPQNAFERENEIESIEQNSLEGNLQKIQQTLLIAKDSTRALNKRRKTSTYNLEMKSASLVEQVSKLTQPEASTSSSSSKSIVQKAEDTDDIFELSYMNDDGISAISDNSESRQEDAGIRNGGRSPAVYNLVNSASTAMAENEGNLLKDALQMEPASISRKRRRRKRDHLPSVIVHGTSLPLKSKSKSLRQIVLETSQLLCNKDTLPTTKSKSQETAKVSKSKDKAAGPIVKLDSSQKKVLEIRKGATLLKTQLQKKNIAKACLIANNLVKKHGSKSLQPWQHILKGFFEISPELARQYVEKGRNILQTNYNGSPPFIASQSPDESRHSSNLQENDSNIFHKKEAKRYKPPLPGTLDKVKKLQFKRKILRFKTLLALDDYKNADSLLEELAKQHGNEVYLWRKILSFCYKHDLKTARQFITTIKTANPYAISGIVFNSVIAEQECRYGDSALGRKTFEKLAGHYSERILHHFVPYLHYLCDVKDFTYARSFLCKNIRKVEHQYNLAKLKKEVRTLERVYDCKLL